MDTSSKIELKCRKTKFKPKFEMDPPCDIRGDFLQLPSMDWEGFPNSVDIHPPHCTDQTSERGGSWACWRSSNDRGVAPDVDMRKDSCEPNGQDLFPNWAVSISVYVWKRATLAFEYNLKYYVDNAY